MEIKRKELYERIWTDKIKGVAETLNMSPIELSAICKANNIPTPSSAYWTSLVYGNPKEKLPLPDEEKDYVIKIEPKKEVVSERKRRTSLQNEILDEYLEKERFNKDLSVKRKIELAKKGKYRLNFNSSSKEWRETAKKVVELFPVPEVLTTKRIIVLNTRKHLKLNRLPWDQRSRNPMYGNLGSVLNIDVTEGLDFRALSLFDTLISVFEALGGTFNYEQDKTILVIDTLKVELKISEKQKRIENTTSDYFGKYRFVNSGKLKLKITKGYTDYVYEDTDYIKLESKVKDITLRLLNMLEQKHKEDEEHRRYLIERERQEEIRRKEEQKRQELEAQKKLERERLKKDLKLLKRCRVLLQVEEVMSKLSEHEQNEGISHILSRLNFIKHKLSPDSLKKGLLDEDDIDELLSEFEAD